MTRPGKWENVKTASGWHLRLVGANGEIILTSEKYTRKAAADAALALAQRSAGDDESEPPPMAATSPNLFTQTEVQALAREAGFTPYNARIMAAICMCEAPYMQGGVPHANFAAVGDIDLANTTWGYSYGGAQVRSLRADKGTGRTRDEDRLLDPLFNMRSARRIKLDAGSFRPWSTFTSGMYKAYLLNAEGEVAYPPPPGTYRVVAGDTLSGIANRVPDAAGRKWPWSDWARANGLHSPYLLRIADVLMIPGQTTPGA